jgi:DNA ligase (NAD+)
MKLVEELKKASEAYYLGEPIMTDAEFDQKVEELRKLDPNHEFFNQVGTEIASTPWPIVEHERSMGSLHKVNTKEEYDKWVEKYTSGVVCVSDKLDGLSLSLVYEYGKLKRGLTRGDGIKGEDITVNIKKLKGVLPELTVGEFAAAPKIAIRGEAILMLEDYHQHFPRTELEDGTIENANPRNCVAVIRRKKDNSMASHVTFIAYDIAYIEPEYQPVSKEEIFMELATLGFKVPFYKVASPFRAWQIFEAYQKDLRAKRPYEIDGLVIEDDNTESFIKQGESSGRPRGARAIKFTAETGESTIRDIVWQVGRTGNVTPVAKIDPITIGGVTITSPSLMNVAECLRLGISKNAKIVVERCNDVIPRIIRAELGDEPFIIPSEVDGFKVSLKVEDKIVRLESDVPMTAEALRSIKPIGINVENVTSIILFCDDPSHPMRKFRRLENFAKVLDIKGIGEKTVRALISAGSLDSITDYFKLTIHDWEHATGSPALAKKVKKEFAAKTASVPVPQFIKSIGMTFFGEDTAKLIESKYPDLRDWFSLTVDQITDIKGIGEAKALAAVEGLKANEVEIRRLLDFIKLGEPEAENENAISVCFTGVRLPHIYMPTFLKKGYKEASGVSKNTQILVLMDTTSMTTKAKKARELGVKMISYDDFLKELKS